MLKVGQLVHTNRGSGVVSGIGESSPYVYVRLNSGPDEIYVMDRSDLVDGDGQVFPYGGSPQRNEGFLVDQTGSGSATRAKRETFAGRRTSSRRSSKSRRVAAETPIALFVNARLAELGLKQCEFCRKTGFDQGLL